MSGSTVIGTVRESKNAVFCGAGMMLVKKKKGLTTRFKRKRNRFATAIAVSSIQRILEWFWISNERSGVAVHVHDLNAIECLFTWFRNVSGIFDPLEFLEPIVARSESFDCIAGLGGLDAHCPIPRSVFVTWPPCVAWPPSPCAVYGSRSVVALPKRWAHAPRQEARYEAWLTRLHP